MPSNLFNPSTSPVTAPGPDVPGFEIREEQTGAFLSDELTIGHWRPLIGLRHSRLEYGATFNTVSIHSSRNSKVTPLLALSHDLSPAATVCASCVTGLENGGLAPVGTNNANHQMPPLETEGCELGV